MLQVLISNSNNFTYSNNTVYVSSINLNKLISSRVETTYLNTKNVDTTYLKLPYSHTLLNNYIYSDMMGTLQFKKQNNTYQLHNGTKLESFYHLIYLMIIPKNINLKFKLL